MTAPACFACARLRRDFAIPGACCVEHSTIQPFEGVNRQTVASPERLTGMRIDEHVIRRTWIKIRNTDWWKKR